MGRPKAVQKSFWGTLGKLLLSKTTIVILALVAQAVLLIWLVIDLSQYAAYVYAGFLVLSALVILCIVNRDDNPDFRLVWMVPVAALPVVGAVIYLFVRLQLGTRLIRRRIAASDAAAAEVRPRDESAVAAVRALAGGADVTGYLEKRGFPAYINTDCTYYRLGDEMFPDILRAVEGAREFIFLEYFILEEGEMWDALFALLREKAAEGLDVRLMYDAVGSLSKAPPGYYKVIRAAGIRCKVFSPMSPILSTHQNNRDHRKVCIVDGTVAFTGGINIADEYINAVTRKCGHWKDCGLRVTGEAVDSMTVSYLQMWNLTERRQEAFEPFLKKYFVPSGGFVVPYTDQPFDAYNVCRAVYLDILNTARSYVYIMTPYLVIDSELKSALVYAAQRGVDVRILLPGQCDEPIAKTIGITYYRELLSGGVKLYAYAPGMLHSKVFLSDDEKAVVGTVNLDYRSLFLTFENAVYLCRHPAVGTVRADFEETFGLCRPITEATYKSYGVFKRIAGRIMRLFAPLV
ncbi:MAG TPA: cardiolipin synthase [Firmicutes bacterium]|nr:cardiolipin synthase [Bacillota bacterium]